MDTDELIAFFKDQERLQQKFGDPVEFYLPIDDLVTHFNQLTADQLSRIASIISQLAPDVEFPQAEINDFRFYYNTQENCLYNIFIKFMTVELFHLINLPQLPDHLNISFTKGNKAPKASDIPQAMPEIKILSSTRTTLKPVAFFKEPTKLPSAKKSRAYSVHTKKEQVLTNSKNSLQAAQAAKFRAKQKKACLEENERQLKLEEANSKLRHEIKQLYIDKQRLTNTIRIKYSKVPDITSVFYKFFPKPKGPGEELHNASATCSSLRPCSDGRVADDPLSISVPK